MPYYIPVAAAVVLVVAWYLRNIVKYYIHYGMFSPAAKLDFPVVGSPTDANFVPALIEGCKKVMMSPFRLVSSGPLGRLRRTAGRRSWS